MELQTTTRRIGFARTIFDDFDERPVDCDFMLPDFLPDIAAILKCTMKPIVQSHQVSGDRVTADGTVYLHVLYLDENRKCVRSFENTQPFTSVFTVKELSSGDAITLSAKTNYVNCRATSPRRMDIHGAFSVKLKVVGRTDTGIVEQATAKGLYSKGGKISYSVPSMCAQKVFGINEVLELGSAAPAETIVRSEAHIAITDCKQMPNKAVVKGDILLKTVYLTDSVAGTLCQAKHSVPFSQILDVDGLTEDSMCESYAEVLSCDVKLSQNPNGECRLLSVSVKSSVTISCYASETCDLLVDAFHTTFPLQLSTQRILTSCISQLSQEFVTVQQTLALPDAHIASVLDVWGEVVTASCSDGTLQGQLLIQLLACDENGTVAYYERPLDMSVSLSGSCGKTDVKASVWDVESVLTGDRLELTVNLFVCRHTCTEESYVAITDMRLDESVPYACTEGMENCQVKVCFANAGDSVWDIAKTEHASPLALMKENDLKEERIREHTMLLIPLA